ncbi:DUF418 domain-containing protein [Vreelandella zhaodongensis]|uniref:DUF418 domain-containing protein n=1 Tax=Vreelandella zhaodongensis TaxID=1176240 RepID=A0ABX2SUC9_VREZH|nr:DUF418 domain-containing protein [Halomonas zhaodongensis]NYS45695.1 DUF418 domain-containing protein [Halomonas zhaodongensis]
MSTVRRSNEVDIIRMAALIGICVVNVPFMALSVESLFTPPDGFYDKSVGFLVESFLQLKFFLLFSFIFGWGMAIQYKSAESKGQSFARRYFRRMIGLAMLGIAHAILVFSGDILFLYALLGTFLWLIKDFTPRRLITFAAWMLPLSMIFLTILAVLIDAVMADKAISFSALGGASLGGGFLEATQARFTDWPITFGFLVLLQGPLALGAFAVGLAAAKTDFFSENSDGYNLIQQHLPLLIIIALPTNILYAAVVGGIVPETYEILSLLGFVLIAIGAPALSLIYLYLFIRLSRMIKMPHLLVLAGQNSLSSYVAQGVLAGFVFSAYGLGLFNSLGHAALIPASLIIALIAMVFVGVYAKIFGRGPLEPILRKISGN